MKVKELKIILLNSPKERDSVSLLLLDINTGIKLEVNPGNIVK